MKFKIDLDTKKFDNVCAFKDYLTSMKSRDDSVSLT